MKFTPHTRDVSQSLLYSPLHALSSATRDEEQAVSIQREGPVKPNVYDTLPAAIESEQPAAYRQ